MINTTKKIGIIFIRDALIKLKQLQLRKERKEDDGN